MPLQGFEARVERMVDGVFSRAFRSSLKPIELGRRLVREMDGHRTLDVHGRAIVPNVYRFSLSPADHHAFSSIEAPLVRELVDAAKEHARDEGYGFLGPLRVELAVDETLRSGRLVLASELAAASRSSVGVAAAPAAPAAAPAAGVVPVPAAPAPAAAAPPPSLPVPGAPLAGDHPAWAAESMAWGSDPSGAAPAVPAAGTSPAAAGPTGADHDAPGTASLLLPTGSGHVLQPGRTATIGRLPACELLVNDPNVSRRHAEVRPLGDGGWLLVDLGSTNGTRVNGTAAGEHALHHGDVITVGGTRIRFEVR